MRTIIKAKIDHETSVRAHEAAKALKGRQAILDDREKSRRQAHASIEIEGGKVPEDAAAIIDRYASGEIDIAEMNEAIRRYAAKAGD